MERHLSSKKLSWNIKTLWNLIRMQRYKSSPALAIFERFAWLNEQSLQQCFSQNRKEFYEDAFTSVMNKLRPAWSRRGRETMRIAGKLGGRSKIHFDVTPWKSGESLYFAFEAWESKKISKRLSLGKNRLSEHLLLGGFYIERKFPNIRSFSTVTTKWKHLKLFVFSLSKAGEKSFPRVLRSRTKVTPLPSNAFPRRVKYLSFRKAASWKFEKKRSRECPETTGKESRLHESE